MCTCADYMDKAVCKHLVAVLLKEKIEFPGLEPLLRMKTFSYRLRRQKKLDSSLKTDDEATTAHATAPIEVATSQTSPVTRPKVTKTKKKKQSEVPKRSSARIASREQPNEAEEEQKRPKLGRPPKVTKALLD